MTVEKTELCISEGPRQLSAPPKKPVAEVAKQDGPCAGGESNGAGDQKVQDRHEPKHTLLWPLAFPETLGFHTDPRIAAPPP